jgi:hypothetical protein
MERCIKNYGKMNGEERSEVIVKRETFVLWMISSLKLDI